MVWSSVPNGPEAHLGNAAPAVCPGLGFADDPSRHYSRPTALHRCFAVEDDALAAGGVGIFVGGDYNQVALGHSAVRLPD